MDASYKKLLECLQILVSLYGNLFDVLQKERLHLIASDIEKLNDSNKTKEALLLKIRQQDKERALVAQELGKQVQLAGDQPRLLAIADKIAPLHKQEAETLRQLHKTLSMQIERVVELNQENESYTKTALRILNGAIDDIKEVAVGAKKKTYGKQGQSESAAHQQSGNFVSKEA